MEQAEPWDEWIELGAAGSPGHYRARFSSMGGTLQELRLDGWYDSGRLSEEARSDPGHWTQLLAPATAGPRKYITTRTRRPLPRRHCQVIAHMLSRNDRTAAALDWRNQCAPPLPPAKSFR